MHFLRTVFLVEFKQDMTRQANGKHFAVDIVWRPDGRQWVKPRLELAAAPKIENEHPPGYILIAHIQEQEEALIIGCEGFVWPHDGADLLESEKVNDMDVNFLGNGGRLEDFLDVIVGRPLPAVHIQVSGQKEQILQKLYAWKTKSKSPRNFIPLKNEKNKLSINYTLGKWKTKQIHQK